LVTRKRLQLTPVQKYLAGAAWSTAQQAVAGGFKATFQFVMTPDSSVHGFGSGREGLAFVIRNSPGGRGALGGNYEGLGYSGIENSLAVEFDTSSDHETYSSPGDYHVSVHTGGTGANSWDEAYSLGAAPTSFALNDGATHTAQIDYVNGILQVSLDGGPRCCGCTWTWRRP
jgi:hypothetical protein